MQAIGDHRAYVQDRWLRFVFVDTVVYMDLSAQATLEDVAKELGTLSRRRHGTPLGISVTLSPTPRTAFQHEWRPSSLTRNAP